MQNLFSDAPEIAQKPLISGREQWRTKENVLYIRKGGAVTHLLLNRFGHSDMLGLSTARDLFISAIISDIFFVERVVKITNVEGNIVFFGSRSAEQAKDGADNLEPGGASDDRSLGGPAGAAP